MTLPDITKSTAGGTRSTTALITEGLREAIGRGLVKAGDRIRQDEVAAQFGVSHIPVREAFRQLTSEGLVLYRPNRGVVVAELSVDEVEELTELRCLLETQIVRWAVPRATDKDTARAAAVLDCLDQHSHMDRILQLNEDFHEALFSPAGRPRIVRMIREVRFNLTRYLRLAWKQADYLPKSQAVHRLILAAYNAHDPDSAARLIDGHIRETGHIIATYLHERLQENS